MRRHRETARIRQRRGYVVFKWKSKEQLRQLLCELVQVQSVSGSQAEKEFPDIVVNKLSELVYFKENPGHLNRTYLSDGRSFINALVKKSPDTKKQLY